MIKFRPGLSLPKAAQEIVDVYAGNLPCTFRWRSTTFTVEVGNTVKEIIDHVRRVRAKKPKRPHIRPEHTLPGVPPIVKQALDDYANLHLQNEVGYGGSAHAAEKQWAKTRLKLIAWAKRKTKAKRVVFMHAHRPNP